MVDVTFLIAKHVKLREEICTEYVFATYLLEKKFSCLYFLKLIYHHTIHFD
jgi:hypothetical protein